MKQPLLKITNLTAGYGQLEVLHSIDMAVPERGLVVIIGPNGSGKSTAIKSIFGLTTQKFKATYKMPEIPFVILNGILYRIRITHGSLLM